MANRNLKSASLLFAAAALLTSCTLGTRDPLPTYTGQPRNALILDMDDASRGATELLIQTALESEAFQARFNVIDRSTLEVMLKDQRLASLGLLDDSTLTRVGRQAGVSVLLKSTLNFLETGSDQVGSAKYGYSTLYTARAQVTLRLLDVETGRIIATATGKGGTSSSKYGEALKAAALERAVDTGIYNLLKTYKPGT